MPIFTEGLPTRNNTFLDEYSAGLGESLGQTAKETLIRSPMLSIIRSDELAAAKDPGGYSVEETFDPMTGMTSPGYEVPKKRMFSQDEAAERAKTAGVKLEFPKDGITEDAFNILVERKQDEMRRQDIIARGPSGFLPGVAKFGTAFGASLLDPINIASAFIPVVGEARYASLLASAGASTLARTLPRLGVGAAEGLVGAALVEPIIYGAAKFEQADYTMLDSALNIGFGGVFGGGLHVLGGSGADAFRAWKGKADPFVRLQGLSVDQIKQVREVEKLVDAGISTPDQVVSLVKSYPPEVLRAAGLISDGMPADKPVAAPRGTIFGEDTEVRIGDRYVPAQWAVVDLADVEATMTKADNQWRDRTRVASDVQIRKISNDPDFDQLQWSPIMDFGAPTLSKDGRVIGGNGRVMGVSTSYDIGRVGPYREKLNAALERFGIDAASIEGMSKPMLVRLLREDVDVKKAAILSNEGGSARMSALEQAGVDADRLGDFRGFDIPESGDLNTAANRGAIRQWVGKFPENQQAELVTAEGYLSPQGLLRLRNAILHRAYGDSPVLKTLIEGTDEASTNLTKALTRVAGTIADARGAISRGDLHDLDISSDLQVAVATLKDLRTKGMGFEEYMAQGDLARVPLDPVQLQLLRYLDDNITSPRAMSELVNSFYDQLRREGDPKQGSLLGDAPVPTKDELLGRAMDQVAADGSAAAKIERLSAETREAALRVSVAQMAEGRGVTVDPIIEADPSIRTMTPESAVAAAERAASVENVLAADVPAAEAVEARAAEKKTPSLEAAEKAAEDAVTMAEDIAARGQEAWKFARAKANKPAETIGETVDVDGTMRPTTDSTGRPIFSSLKGILNFWRNFDGSKVVDDQGRPLAIYHGSGRPDRIGNRFQKNRATSGPMAFFTDDPTIASSYAMGKQDTSLAYEETGYSNWFKFKPKGSRSTVDIVRAWYSLDPETKAVIREMAPKLRLDDEATGVMVEEGNTRGNGSYDYNLQQTQRGWDRTGNPLAALVEDWLNSGNLYDREELFLDVLRKVGFPVKDVAYDSPNASFPGVFRVFLNIKNPLDTANVPEHVIDALKAAAKRDRSRPAAGGADLWDKNTRTLREWVDNLTDPSNTDKAFVWTSIPDKVTAVFKDLGYDGIKDTGGKGGGVTHTVWIPFEETQVKSALGNRGTFDATSKNINYSRGDAPAATSVVRRNNEWRIVDGEGNLLDGGYPSRDAAREAAYAMSAGATDTVKLTETLRRSFGSSTEALLDSGRIKIVESQKDLPGGPHPDGVYGATTPDGTVYIVAQNVRNWSPYEINGLVLHEVGEHVGMEKMLGADIYADVLKQVADGIARGDDAFVRAASMVPADTKPEHIAAEQLAYLVQNAPELPLVQRIIAAIREWAYRTFQFARDKMELTEADLRSMAVSALHAVAKGDRAAAQSARFATAFSRMIPKTETLAFKNWFGKSVVVDASGKPLVVFHGSPDMRFVNEDGTFKSTKERLGMRENDPDRAFFFAADRNTANTYADDRRAFDYQRAEPGIVAAYLRLENPMIIDAKGADWTGTRNAMAEAKAAGHDGVVIKNVRDEYNNGKNGGRKTDVYVVFNSTQIKSATDNVGTFDGSNPDIRYSRDGDAAPDVKAEMRQFDEAIKRAELYVSAVRAAADRIGDDAAARSAMDAASGGNLTKIEIDDLLTSLRQQNTAVRNRLRKVRDAVTAEDNAATMQSDAMKAADELANNIKMAAVIEKRNGALNLAARTKALTFVMSEFKGNEAEGLKALLAGSQLKRRGARMSVDAEQKGFEGEWVGGIIAEMERENLWRLFTSETMARETARALYMMGDPKADLSGLPKEAVKMAEIIHRFQEDARNTQNRFGAWIRDMKGYIVRQTHDMFRIRKEGFQAWRDYVLPRIDLDKTFYSRGVDDIEVGLREMWNNFSSGQHMKFDPDEELSQAFPGMGRSEAKKQSQSRVLYFKDGDGWFDYNERFGAGRFADSVLGGLERASRASALMKVLGTNPEATLTRLMDEIEDGLRADPEARARFHEERRSIENLFAHVDGRANIPGSHMGAQVSSGLRAWQSMAKLGGAVISSITDIPVYASEQRFQGRGLLSGMADALGGLMHGRGSAEQQQILSSLGVFFDSMRNGVARRFDAQENLGGKTSKLMQQFFKWNGLTWWTEVLRGSSALSLSHHLAENTAVGFGKLSPELRNLLGLYNIDEAKWDLIRLGATKEADGRLYLTPEGVASVPRAALENYITGIGRTVNDASVQNLVDDLSGALRSLYIDRAEHAVIEPDARTRALMLRGTNPGTVWGEVARFIAQFKSFPVAMLQKTMGREIYGRGYDTLGQYLKNGKGDMLGLAHLMLWLTLFGYAGMSIKDMLKGRSPRDPLAPGTWTAAFLQGGGAGIYGDFIFGEMRNRFGGGVLNTVAGPVFGTAEDIMDLYGRIKAGDDAAAKAFRVAVNNTPFLNMFYTRMALDYLLLYNIQEQLNPGYLRRMERRIEKENGQTFLIKPSEVVR